MGSKGLRGSECIFSMVNCSQLEQLSIDTSIFMMAEVR